MSEKENEKSRDPEGTPEQQPQEQPEEQTDKRQEIGDHLTELIKQGQSGKFHCPECSMSFESLKALGDHWRMVHGT